MRNVDSWGRLTSLPHEVVQLNDPTLATSQIHQHCPGIAYGMGRSYGDVCLNPGGFLWRTAGLDHYIEFNEVTGRLVCESGVLLRDIQRLMIPRGWSLPVTPGTQWVTVGGAIANDVHGKNHHRMGSFGDHVRSIRMARTDGEIIECGPSLRPDWFAATVGGLGLTGVILEADIQLYRIPGAWLDTDTVPYENLKEFFSLADVSEKDWEHTVSWIDCIYGKGPRGLFMRGNPLESNHRVEPMDSKLSIPFVPPISLVNRLTLRPFNMIYFNLKKAYAGRKVAHHESFFYPLDNLLHWNRMYGPKGFFQYQSVVPRRFGLDSIQAMLAEIARSKDGSFLGVLKTFGNRQSLGMLSFPQSEGVTLALDFPNRGPRTLKLFDRLDAIVREAGGRIYLAKDARAPRNLFESGYPRLNEFLKYRDPGITSALSRRLLGS